MAQPRKDATNVRTWLAHLSDVGSGYTRSWNPTWSTVSRGPVLSFLSHMVFDFQPPKSSGRSERRRRVTEGAEGRAQYSRI